VEDAPLKAIPTSPALAAAISALKLIKAILFS
jgi:hypothetical protein